MATMDRPTFAAVVSVEPEVVLQADVASLPEQDRAVATEALLQAHDSGTALTPPWETTGAGYGVIIHPDLANQVRPFLADRAHNEAARTVAVDIARACQLTQLQDELLRLALDRGESVRHRMLAVLALADVGDRDIRERLHPLLESRDDDADDELFGAVLRALWPDVLNAPELFAILRPPNNRGLLGNYYSTLHYHVLPHLGVHDLPVALQWASTITSQNAAGDALRDLVQEIMVLSFRHVDDLRVREAIARALVRRPAHEAFGHQPLDRDIQAMIASDTDGRHLLAMGVVRPSSGSCQ